MEQGTLSVSTENIFPIIKQSLYSEQEIFLRELVSNAVDATQKLKHLSSIGEFQGELGELKITIAADQDAKTLTIRDAGLGMTADEVKKYLNQVAFSGAEEFVRKFKDSNSAGEIIGKFGLGFYSAFMVAGTVEVLTRSWQDGAEAVRWTCDGTVSYSLDTAERESRGTDIILHLSEDALEYLESARIREILEKYCRFLPVEIEFEGEVINNPNPVWKKAPADLQDEDYLGLFRELYPAAEDPLFWIHLNVDFPFTLNGILYFPRIRQDIDPRKNQIQLYSRQVFITDEVSQIVPDYLMLLQGVIDSPDIPLNVSRSYLQGDPNVKKIRDYITRKVADRLNEIFRDDRGKFEEKWRDISVFVKYGMLTDDKFYEKAEKFALVENMDGLFFTLAEYREKIAPEQTDSSSSVVYLYATDRQAQDMFIRAAASRSYDVVLMNGVLDSHFIGLTERKIAQSRWVRVDSDTLDKLIPKESAEAPPAVLLTDEQKARVEDLFRKAFDRKEAVVKAEALQHETLPVVITRPEFMRRMREMAATGGMSYLSDLPDSFNVIVNTRHPLVMRMAEGEGHEALASQLADLALLSQGMLTGAPLTDFIHRSVDLLAPQAQ
ncbi:MAG: molecular chaperone HtpG [Bacteroidia bacterium]|nr:molecular chaperone HtpG [Bacteroidia bacterium]